MRINLMLNNTASCTAIAAAIKAEQFFKFIFKKVCTEHLFTPN